MPTQKTETPKGADGPAGLGAVDPSHFVEANARSLAAMARMNQQIYRNMLRIQSEFLDFTNRRLSEDAEVSRRLTRARQPNDAIEIVNQFQRKALSDYADEASTLMRLGAEMTGEIVEEAQEEIGGAGNGRGN